MRTLGLGSVVLGFVLVLMSWDATRRFAHVRLHSPAPSIEIGDLRAEVSVTPAPAHAGREATSAKPAAPSPQPEAIEAIRSAARPGTEARRSMAEMARRSRDAPPLSVREFTPGSKAHAEAIASTIASNEHRNTVEPLARLYFAFFDRVADFEGLSYYIDERDGDVSLASIAEEFAGSTEFRLRYGTLDNAAFIDRIYRNIFDAVPDSAQRAYWIGQLDAGMSRGNVMLAFSESGAFRTATSNEVFVTMAYAETLRQAPDAAGLARWVRVLEAGNPREAVIAGLLGGTRKTR